MDKDIDDERVTAREYDRWQQGKTLLARWVRFWFAPPRTLWLNTQIRKLPAAAGLKPEDRVLDIGCGFGGLPIYLFQKVGFTQPIEALDGSPLMLERARSEIRQRKMEDAIRLTQGMATQLPYADGAFDVVV